MQCPEQGLCHAHRVYLSRSRADEGGAAGFIVELDGRFAQRTGCKVTHVGRDGLGIGTDVGGHIEDKLAQAG